MGVWDLDEEGCDRPATFDEFLSVTQRFKSAEEASVRPGYAGFKSLLGLGLLHLRVRERQGSVFVCGGITTVQNNVVEVVTENAFVPASARSAIEQIPEFVVHQRLVPTDQVDTNTDD